MTETIIRPKGFNTYTFKANGKLVKRRFMPKIVSRRVTLEDSANGRFRSSLTLYVPKLRPNHVKPCVMLHVSNGAGSCLIRVNEPLTLIKALDELAHTLRTDKWIDFWERANEISDELVVSDRLIEDEDIIDMDEWHDELSSKIDVGRIEIKEELGGEK